MRCLTPHFWVVPHWVHSAQGTSQALCRGMFSGLITDWASWVFHLDFLWEPTVENQQCLLQLIGFIFWRTFPLRCGAGWRWPIPPLALGRCFSRKSGWWCVRILGGKYSQDGCVPLVSCLNYPEFHFFTVPVLSTSCCDLILNHLLHVLVVYWWLLSSTQLRIQGDFQMCIASSPGKHGISLPFSSIYGIKKYPFQR